MIVVLYQSFQIGDCLSCLFNYFRNSKFCERITIDTWTDTLLNRDSKPFQIISNTRTSGERQCHCVKQSLPANTGSQLANLRAFQ